MKHRTHTILILLALLLVNIIPLTAQGEIECQEGYRYFDHELMTSDPLCIPEDPQRIVSLDMSGTEFLLVIDAPLVGAFDYVASEITALTPGLGEKLENVERLDWPPNLEVLTELAPDLIVSFSDPQLDLAGVDEIAPLIIYDPSLHKGEWKASTEFYSEVFQKQDDFTDMMAIYEARIEDLQTALGEDRGEVEVSLMLPTTENPLIWLQDSAPGRILEDVGLGRPAFQVDPTIEASESGISWGFVNISLERLDLADGDEIFIFTWASSDPEVVADRQQAIEDFQTNNQLWQALEGVQAGNVHIVGGQWVRAQTYLTVNLILDDLFNHLTDVEPTIPSPAAEWTDTAAVGGTSAGDFPMTIEHELGTTTIDAIPERVVVLEYSFADHLGTLGIAPVGFAVDAPPDYIYAYTSDLGAVDIGTRAEPSLEAILELSPDFIVADLTRHAGIYDDLSLIAPTVVFNSLRGSYDDQLEQFGIIANVLGKSDEAAEILAGYQKTFEAAMETTHADAGEFVIGVLWSGGYTAHSSESFMGSFLESLGRTNALEPRDGETQYVIDMEGFASVNPATIVILCNPADQEFLDSMTDSALWEAFDAVVNNRVYTFDRNLWSKGRGVTAYETILSDAVNSGLLADTASPGVTCVEAS